MGQFVLRLGAGDAVPPNRPKPRAAAGVSGELRPRDLRVLVVGEVVVVVEKKQAHGLGHDEIPRAVLAVQWREGVVGVLQVAPLPAEHGVAQQP